MSPIVTFCAITGLINFTTAALLGCFLLFKSYQIKANRYFAYFCFSVAFWSLFYFIWLITPDNRLMAEFYLRTCMIGVFFCPSTFFHFVVRFLNRKVPTWFIIFNYVFSIACMFIVYTPLYAYDLSPFIGFLWLKPGILFHFIVFDFAAVVGCAFICLWDSYLKTQEKGFKKQIQLVLIALSIAFASGSMNYLMWYRIPVPPVANALVAVYVLIISYAILKYQLLDIKIVIKNSLVYSVLASLITVLYFGVIYFSEHILKITLGYHSAIASLVTAILVAIFFIPVKDFIQSIVEKYVFKATYIQITEQNERLRRQIMLSERYKTFSEIAKSVTVAIRDPLTTLKIYSQHYHNRLDDRSFLEKFDQVLAREIQKIQDLTDGLSKYSSPEPLSIQRTDIYSLVNDVLESLQHQLTTQKITLHKYSYYKDSSFWLHIDPKQMQQVLTNIIMNSFKTMPKGGQLWVGMEKKDDIFMIFIKDTGSPIPKDQLEKVFDPFYRYQEENQGLDLAIAFSIVENHGGKILLESHLDTGNEFIIHLPIMERNASGKSASN